MDLYGHVLCPTCRTEYRIRRRLEKGARYRFQCKRCGSESSFELATVRWACERQRRPRRETPERIDRTAAIAHRAEREQNGHDTVYDPRPPFHLEALVRRGIPSARETSHVSWLRALQARRAQHLAVASSF